MDNTIVNRPDIGSRRGPWPWLALLVVAVGIAGFSRSYYFKGFFHSPTLSVTVHVHGLLMSLWLVIFAAQVGLVAAHRIRWHQCLGLAASGVALLVVASGVFLTVRGLEAEVQAHKVGRFHYLLGLNLVNLLVFVVFVGCGLLFRKRGDVHKRCMTLAAVSLLAPATARIALLFSHGVAWQFVAFYSCIAACVLVDTSYHRHLHPVYVWGCALIVLAFQGIYFFESGRNWLPLVVRAFGG